MKPENLKCPDCGGDMTPRKSQFGIFWGCIKFPACKGTRDSMGMSKEDKKDPAYYEDEDFRWDRK